MKQDDPKHPDHYCKPPKTSTPGARWKCKCGRKFRYVAEQKTFLGRLIAGHWLQTKG